MGGFTWQNAEPFASPESPLPLLGGDQQQDENELRRSSYSAFVGCISRLTARFISVIAWLWQLCAEISYAGRLKNAYCDRVARCLFQDWTRILYFTTLPTLTAHDPAI